VVARALLIAARCVQPFTFGSKAFELGADRVPISVRPDRRLAVSAATAHHHLRHHEHHRGAGQRWKQRKQSHGLGPSVRFAKFDDDPGVAADTMTAR
jgi:hypothetical protein